MIRYGRYSQGLRAATLAMSTQRKVGILLLGSATLFGLTACQIYRGIALDEIAAEIEVGDDVRVFDWEGASHRFEVTNVSALEIAGKEFSIEVTHISSLERRQSSVPEFGFRMSKGFLALIYLAGMTYPFWVLFV